MIGGSPVAFSSFFFTIYVHYIPLFLSVYVVGLCVCAASWIWRWAYCTCMHACGDSMYVRTCTNCPAYVRSTCFSYIFNSKKPSEIDSSFWVFPFLPWFKSNVSLMSPCFLKVVIIIKCIVFQTENNEDAGSKKSFFRAWESNILGYRYIVYEEYLPRNVRIYSLIPDIFTLACNLPSYLSIRT